MKLIEEENVGGTFLEFFFFFGYVSSGKGTKAKVNKWGYSKLKSFCTAKETVNKMKSLPTA